MEYSADDVLIELEPGFGTDCRDLADKLRILCVDCIAPDGTEPVGVEHKWGQSTFKYNWMFAKARYECMVLNRAEPFRCIENDEAGIRLALSVGLPTADLLGRFAVKCGNDWLWSGTLSEYLRGYSNPDESDVGVDTVLSAIDIARYRGILHPDMHAGNVLAKDGDIRIVDLAGISRCEPGDRNAAAAMAQKYLSMLSSSEAKDKVRRYVYAL